MGTPTPNVDIVPGQLCRFETQDGTTWAYSSVYDHTDYLGGVTQSAIQQGEDLKVYLRNSQNHPVRVWDPSNGLTNSTDLTASLPNFPSIASSPVVSPDEKYVVIVATNGHLYVCTNLSTPNLKITDVTKAAGGCPVQGVPACDFDPTQSGLTMNVYVWGTNNLLVCYQMEGNGEWDFVNISQQTGTAKKPICGSPTIGSDGRIYVIGTDWHVRAYFSALEQSQMRDITNDLPNSGEAPEIRSESATVGVDGMLRIFGYDERGHLFMWTGGPVSQADPWNWTVVDITATVGGTALVVGTPVCSLDGSQVIARGTSGQLLLFSQLTNGAWTVADLALTAAGGCLVNCDPALFQAGANSVIHALGLPPLLP